MNYDDWKAELIKGANHKSVHQGIIVLEQLTFPASLLNKVVKMEETMSLFMRQGELCIEIEGKSYKIQGMGTFIALPGQMLNIVSVSLDFNSFACMASMDFFNCFDAKNAAQTYLTILKEPCHVVEENVIEKN